MAISKEDKIGMFTMKLDGMTYQEIGEAYGVSKQFVYQVLSAPGRTHKATNSIIYPGLRKWLEENCMTITKLQSLMGLKSANVSGVYAKLRNKGKIRIGDIKKILKITGLTFEECFGEEDDVE